MPKRSVLTERFRRVSTQEVFRRSSKAEHNWEPPTEPSPQRLAHPRAENVSDTLFSPRRNTGLLNLPTELAAQILSYVDFDSLAAFRLASRTTHHLVFEGEIVRQWIHRHIGGHRLFLNPPPVPPTFVYALEQHRRWLTVMATSDCLVDYIEHEILRHTLRRANVYTDQYRQGLFGLVKIRLREKMVPLLFTIQRYLELKTRRTFSPPSSDDKDDEHAFLSSLAPGHLLQTHKCVLFLTWLSNQILARPSYAGSLERTMRGWLSDPLDISNFRRYFLLGNLGALRNLVVLPSYKHRRKCVEAVMRGLDPEQNVLWRQHWEKVGGDYGGVVVDEGGVKGVLGLRLSAEEVWVRAARVVLVEKGLLGEGEEMDIGSAWQTMDFLCDIAGYDVLHTPPSWSTSGA